MRWFHESASLQGPHSPPTCRKRREVRHLFCHSRSQKSAANAEPTRPNDQIDQNGVQIQWWIHLNISSLHCISSQTVIPYTSGAQFTALSPILSFWCFISFMNSMPHNAVVTAQRKYCCLDITRRSQNLKPLEVHSLTPKSYLWHVLMHCPHKLCKK